MNIIEIVRRGEKEILEVADFVCQIPFILFNDDILNNSLFDFESLKIFHDYNINIDNNSALKCLFLKLKKTTNKLDKNEDDFIKLFDEIKDDTIKKNNALVTYRKRDKNKKYSAQEISQIWIGYVINQKTMKMNDRHYRDLWHLCKPIVYCDIVTMDKTWKAFIDETLPNYSSKIITDKNNFGFQLLIDKIKTFKTGAINGNQ